MRSAWAQPRFGERWDGLDENGECPIGDDGTDMMISYNHYASGAVGAFLYRRVLGVEPTEAGTASSSLRRWSAAASPRLKASVGTPYGVIKGCMEDRGRRDDDDRGGARRHRMHRRAAEREEKCLAAGNIPLRQRRKGIA